MASASARPAGLSAVLRVAVTWAAFFALALGCLVLLGGLVWLLAFLDLDDRLAYYRTPDTREGSVVLVDAAGEIRPCLQGDYDGDGVKDGLRVALVRRKAPGGPTTPAFFGVRSGRTGEWILLQGLAGPFSRAEWVGDVDGNGTDDVRIVSEQGPGVVYGWTEPAQSR